MRELSVSILKEKLTEAILHASYDISSDIYEKVSSCAASDESPVARDVLTRIRENYDIASRDRVAICQDTGMCVVFAEIGQDVHFTDGFFGDAINEAVEKAYRDGYLRKSVVRDPLYDRVNTGTNTPAIVHTSIVPGDKVKLTVVCKGFGSENMSRVGMLTPAMGEKGVIDFVTDVVRNAGANPCPPIILGVCIGGDFEQAALMAKKMTARPAGSHNENPKYAALEDVLMEKVNALGIGPAGFGGNTTCLAINVAALPTHIAGMPVAVNVCCHCSRHAVVEI